MDLGRLPPAFAERKPFPAALKTLMRITGATQTSIAEYVNVQRQTVSLYANGQSTPDIETFKEIVRYFREEHGLNVSYDFLLDNSGVIERTNVDIGQRLGLTDMAIHALEKINCLTNKLKDIGKENDLMEAVNRLLESEENYHTLSHICLFLSRVTVDFDEAMVTHTPTAILPNSVADIMKYRVFETAVLNAIEEDLRNIKSHRGAI